MLPDADASYLDSSWFQTNPSPPNWEIWNIGDQLGWWLNQPIWIKNISHIGSSPQGSGVKINKSLKPPPSEILELNLDPPWSKWSFQDLFPRQKNHFKLHFFPRELTWNPKIDGFVDAFLSQIGNFSCSMLVFGCGEVPQDTPLTITAERHHQPQTMQVISYFRFNELLHVYKVAIFTSWES